MKFGNAVDEWELVDDAPPNVMVTALDEGGESIIADGELLVCEPADRLPMAQRYFLF